MSIGAGSDLPPLVALVQADVADFLAKVQVVSGQLDSLSSKDTQTTIGANIADFESKMAAVNEALAEWGSAEGTADARLAIDEAMASFAAVEAELDKWGASHATATADIDVAPAIAKITALHALAGSGGGGGSGTTGLLSRLLWGGGSGGIYGLGAGLAGFGSLGSLAGFGPEHLATVGLGLAGSATGGLIGGGILAAGSLGTAAVGAGTDLAGIGQAVGDTKSTLTNLNALSAAQQEYGKNSAQAAAAQSTLNQQLQGFNQIAVGAVVQTAETAQGFVKMFDAATGAAEKTGAEILTQAIHVGEEFLPTIGKFAAENTSIIQKDIQPLFSWMGGQGLQIFTDLENKFQGELPTSLNALTQGIELFARTIDLASQSTGGLMSHLSDFLTRMNGADFDTWSAKVEKLIGDFRLWDDFIKILFKDIADLFSKDVGTASGIVTTLTNALNSLHEWINSTTGSAQLRTVFEVHKEQILELLPVIGNLIENYGHLFLTIAPYAVTITDALVKALADLLGIIEKSGPLGDYALAIALIAGKLNLIGPAFKLAFGTDVVKTALSAMAADVGAFVSSSGALLTGLGTKFGLVATDAGEAGTAVAGVGTEATVAATSVGEATLGMASSLGALLGPIALVVAGFETINKLMADIKSNGNINAQVAPTGNLQTAIAEVNASGVGTLTGQNSTQVLQIARAVVTAYDQTHPQGSVPAGILPGTSSTGAPYITAPITGGRPESNLAAAAAVIPTGNVSAPTGPTTASQAAAAQVPAAVTQGMATLARLVADVHSTSLATLRSAVVQVHEKGFSSLIAQLDAIHSTASLKLASQLENVAKEAGKNQTAEVKRVEEAEAAARVAATVQAENTMSADVQTKINDAAAALTQAASDLSRLNSDTSAGQVSSIGDLAAVQSAQSNAQVAAIQDAAQIAADQLAETGLTGTALQAAQAQVALDIQKQTDDAKINADQVAIAIQKQTDDANIAAATTHADQVAQQQDQLVATAQARLDAVTIKDQTRVSADQIAYAVAEASQNIKLQQQTLTQLNAATQDQSTDLQNYGNLLSAAQTNQQSANQDAQGNLASVQGLAAVLEAGLAAVLAGDQGAAAIAEAQLAAIVTGLNSVASSTAATASATTSPATAPIQVTVVTQIDGQQVALTTTPLIRQELLRSTARQTQNVLGGSAGRLTPSR